MNIQMTDQQWQHQFELMKKQTPPSHEHLLPNMPREHISYDLLGNKHYDGYSNWQTYCSYINDVLRQIRKGGIDYCYYIYQIQELVRFEPVRLHTRYLPDEQYWVVWLEQ